MRIDDLSVSSERFVVRVAASGTTANRRTGRRPISPTANPAFDSALAVPSERGKSSADVYAAATAVAEHAPLPTSTSQGACSVALSDLAAPALMLPGNPVPLTV